MDLKKVFEMPLIEVVQFDARDVITESVFESTSVYDIPSIKDIFNIKT